MVKINNKRRCGALDGEVQDASPLATKNTQEYRDVIAMSHFKLSASISYLDSPFNQLANSINGLWLNEGDPVPKFAEKFVDCWSLDDYAVFCEQVKQWALDHDADPFEELRRRVRELILYDKKSFQLLTISTLLKKSKDDEQVLFDQQANVQQLCNEIGEKDDQLAVETDDFKHSTTQFDRLKLLVRAMRIHSNYLVNQRLTRRQMVNVNIDEQAKLIAKPVQKQDKPNNQRNKSKDDEIEPGQ